MSDERNWQGEPQTLDAECAESGGFVRIWTVTPHPATDEFDELWVREWHKLVSIVSGSLDTWLEAKDLSEFACDGGVTLTFRLKDVPRGEYEDSQRQD